MPEINDIITTDATGKSVWAHRGNAVVKVIPTSGQTVSFPANRCDTTLWVAPVAPLAALTVSLPGDSDSVDGQKCSLVATQAIATLTVTGSPLGAINTMELGQYTQFLRLESGTWCTA